MASNTIDIAITGAAGRMGSDWLRSRNKMAGSISSEQLSGPITPHKAAMRGKCAALGPLEFRSRLI